MDAKGTLFKYHALKGYPGQCVSQEWSSVPGIKSNCKELDISRQEIEAIHLLDPRKTLPQCTNHYLPIDQGRWDVVGS